MEYQFCCKVRATDLWKMAMSATYRSLAGIVNVTFTVAAFCAAFRFWNVAGSFARGLLVFGCAFFPLIQPLAILGRCAKLLEDGPKAVELLVNDDGIRVTAGEKHEQLTWNRIRNAIRRRDSIIIFSDDVHGYVLTNQVLGDQKEDFFRYLKGKLLSFRSDCDMMKKQEKY